MKKRLRQLLKQQDFDEIADLAGRQRRVLGLLIALTFDSDAVIGWRVFKHWNPTKIETIPISPKRIRRIGYVPAAVSTYSKHPALARDFIRYLCSKKGRAIFAKWHYLATEGEARSFALPNTPVGGQWQRPDGRQDAR